MRSSHPHDVRDEINETDFIVIDLSSPLPAEIVDAADAFQRCISQSVSSAFTKNYQPPHNLPMSFVHGMFCDEGYFSWLQTGKTVVALGVGAAFSLFSVSPSRNAVSYLARLLTDDPLATFSGEGVVMVIAQVMNVSRTALITTYTTSRMLEKYLVKSSSAQIYLKIDKPRADGTALVAKTWRHQVADKAQLLGRQVFDLSCAVGGSLPVLFSLWSTNQAMGITAFLASIPNMWFGMNNLPLTPKKIYPARRVEVAYLREQLHTFLLLPRASQLAAMNKIKLIEESHHPNKGKVIFERLMNLCNPELLTAEERAVLNILQTHPLSRTKKAVTYATSVLGGYSQLPFTEASGVDVARLFANQTSPSAMALGVLSAALALLPTVGFGVKGGKRAGEQMLIDHPTLGKVVNPRWRDGLKWLLLFLNLFAAGTSISFAYTASTDFAKLLALEAEAQRIMTLTLTGAAYVGATMSLGQYIIDALDELLLFIARRHEDEETQCLMQFVGGFDQLIMTLENMNQENYLDILANWKLAGGSLLANTLHAIYSKELSDNEYVKLQQDLSAAFDLRRGLQDSHTVVLDNRLFQDNYRVIERKSFLDRYQGLRRRRPTSGAADVATQFEENTYPLHAVTPTFNSRPH